MMLRGKYKGPVVLLFARSALLREDALDREVYLAQFDELGLEEAEPDPVNNVPYCYGWHKILREHFELIVPT